MRPVEERQVNGQSHLVRSIESHTEISLTTQQQKGEGADMDQADLIMIMIITVSTSLMHQ
jgi:hypothetical protein